MSNPRASIQRAVTAPPARTGSVAMAAVADRSAASEMTPAPTRPIGKPHGRMRCVNLCLSISTAEQLRQLTRQRNLTLGEALMEIVSHSVVPHRPLRNGRQPTSRRHVSITNVYVLLTESEAADLRDRASTSGRTISDYADLAISNTQSPPVTADGL